MAPAGSREGFDARVDAVIDGRERLADYEQWLARTGSPSDEYLFAEARSRFTAEADDIVVLPEDVRVLAAPKGVELRSASLGGGVRVTRVTPAAAGRVLAAIDGRRSLGEISAAVAEDRPALERVLAAALGSLLFVPSAVTRLEQAISGTELVRFVGAPYEIVRSYWANMADVRQAAAATLGAARDAAEFTRWLQRLHVVALLGRDLTRFYRPASRIAARAAEPGRLYETAVALERTLGRTRFVSGPRVGVNLVGGERYHALVYARDPEALLPERHITDTDGLAWGGVVTGRADGDANDAAWFCPPRPLSSAHFAKLFAAFTKASRPEAAREAVTTELARFHYRFVRLHPFRCANQSLAMNLVNLVLGSVHGAGMPHLLLDQFALRLGEDAYLDVFRRAVEAQVRNDPTLERWARLRAAKQKAYALIERLKSAESAEAARALLEADPEAARLALLDA